MRCLVMLVGASLLSLASACNDEKTAGEKADTSVIVPLKAGRAWVGTYTTHSYEPYSTASTTYTYSIIDTFTVQGEKWFVIERKFGTDAIGHKWSLTNRKDGLWSRGLSYADTSSGDYPLLYAKFPTEIDARYDGFGVECFVRVSAIDTSITVPAGTFRCYGYEWRDNASPDYGTFYLSPGIGWVKEEVHSANVFTIWELQELKR
jgi:hypothetical protein